MCMNKMIYVLMVVRETDEVNPGYFMEVDCWIGLPNSRHLFVHVSLFNDYVWNDM